MGFGVNHPYANGWNPTYKNGDFFGDFFFNEIILPTLRLNDK